MQTTLIILKPDCLAQGVAGKVLDRFEKAGLEVAASKMMVLTPELLREHYAHLVEKPFYPSLERFMCSRPVIVMVLRGENAVEVARELLGPTDWRKAAKGTIRGDFATGIMENVAHASDSLVSAEGEVARFFAESEVFEPELCEA